MNKIYRVVWNTELGQWVVASEVAKGKKKASAGKIASIALAVVTVSTFSSPASAVLSLQQFTNGQYCETNGDDSDQIWSQTYPCINLTGGSGNNGTRNPGQNVVLYSRNSVLRGEDSIAMGGDLDVWGNSSLHGLSMNGTRITGVGTAAAGTDAVNLNLLNSKINQVTTNVTDQNAVHYDTGTSNAKVTLAGGVNGTTITNVKAGDISVATSKDAVNGGQLFTTNQNVTNLTNNYNTLNTTVDGLRDNALLWDGTSAYTAKHAGTDAKIKNLAAGAVSDISTDAINGSQLFGTADSVAAALGGGSAVGTDGKISMPSYKVSAGYAKPIGKKSQISFGAAFGGSDHSIGVGFAHRL